MEKRRSRYIILFVTSNSSVRIFVIFHFTDRKLEVGRVELGC